MTTDPDQIRAQVDALLTDLPDAGLEAASAAVVAMGGIDEVARRLEEAHDVLVQALESVEKG